MSQSTTDDVPWPFTIRNNICVRTVRATTPAWLFTHFGIPEESRVLHVNTTLTTLFASPTSMITITPAIRLPPAIYGKGAKLARTQCRLSNLNTGSIKGSVTTPGHITLVLHDVTKNALFEVYNVFLDSFPMRHVGEGMKDVFRANFKSRVDKAGWKLGLEVIKACDADGCANLSRHYRSYVKRNGHALAEDIVLSPRTCRRPRKNVEMDEVFGEDYPMGLREMVEDAVGEIKALFVAALPGVSGLRVNMWHVRWRVPDGEVKGDGREYLSSPRGEKRFVIDLTEDMDAEIDSGIANTINKDSNIINDMDQGEDYNMVDAADENREVANTTNEENIG